MEAKEKIRLNMFGLPLIQSIEDFSELTHISKYTIYQLSKNSSKYYKTFSIPKKTGGKRIICQPSKKLKGLQSWILVNILNKLKVSSSSKGFEKGKSTADNAAPHIGANTLLTLDIEDFFPTIYSNKIFCIFRNIGYNNIISMILTNICTFNGSLPQGSPCSPKLANLSSWKLDMRIQGYVGKKGINYTRYADDLSFSGLNPSKVVKIIPMIKSIIKDEGHNINKKKTRIAGAARSKRVTGLVLSNNSFGIGRKKYKNLRSEIYKLTLPNEQSNIKLLKKINGWLSYLNSVDKTRLKKALFYIKDLQEKYSDKIVCKLNYDTFKNA